MSQIKWYVSIELENGEDIVYEDVTSIIETEVAFYLYHHADLLIMLRKCDLRALLADPWTEKFHYI
jgi:hypothetical protein